MPDLGRVTFKIAGQPVIAHLSESGWTVPAAPELAKHLDSVADPAAFGPADGDPVWCAVEAAAESLGATETWARPVPDYPADAVH